MNVKCATEHIEKITEVCNEIEEFYSSSGLAASTGFLIDAVAYLGDYRKVLEKAIDMAELDI